MRFPTLRFPRLCRLLPYLLVLGIPLLPIILICSLTFLPDLVQAGLVTALVLLPVFYLFRESMTLMMLDMCLAWLSCYRTARTQYAIPAQHTQDRIERRIARFGAACSPGPLLPQPAELRYKFSAPWTTYSRGIEKVVATYHTEVLDQDACRAILSSAKTNSKALAGKKKALFLDSQQKKAPLNRVTVIFIFAQRVDPRLIGGLHELVCNQAEDGFEKSILPCVIDLSRNICVFDSLRIPYVGFGYAAKNRGIRLIRRFVFGGRLPLKENRFFLPQKDPIDLDQSLWEFWRTLRQEANTGKKEVQRKLQSMVNGEILLDEDLLYVKWDGQGILLEAAQNPENKTIRLEAVEYWTYPKSRPISKKAIHAITDAIKQHFAETGWSVVFDNAPEPE